MAANRFPNDLTRLESYEEAERFFAAVAPFASDPDGPRPADSRRSTLKVIRRESDGRNAGRHWANDGIGRAMRVTDRRICRAATWVRFKSTDSGGWEPANIGELEPIYDYVIDKELAKQAREGSRLAEFSKWLRTGNAVRAFEQFGHVRENIQTAASALLAGDFVQALRHLPVQQVRVTAFSAMVFDTSEQKKKPALDVVLSGPLGPAHCRYYTCVRESALNNLREAVYAMFGVYRMTQHKTMGMGEFESHLSRLARLSKL